MAQQFLFTTLRPGLEVAQRQVAGKEREFSGLWRLDETMAAQRMANLRRAVSLWRSGGIERLKWDSSTIVTHDSFQSLLEQYALFNTFQYWWWVARYRMKVSWLLLFPAILALAAATFYCGWKAVRTETGGFEEGPVPGEGAAINKAKE